MKLLEWQPARTVLVFAHARRVGKICRVAEARDAKSVRSLSLNALEPDIPAGKTVHAVLHNYAVHKHAKVRSWLARHPRWTFHFVPRPVRG